MQSWLMAAALFGISFYVCRDLFHVEYLRHMGSIEGAYIGISRYALAHWRDLTWFPLWYDGIPYQNTYPPLLHWGVALIAGLRGITPAHAYHWTIALAYCLGPVTVFALVRRLSGSRWAGFTAGLLYAALSPSAFLIHKVVVDTGGVFRPRRLHALLFWGEGPHVSAMTLLPVAILLVDLAIEKRKFYLLAAPIALAAVTLTNWLAAFALALGMAAYLVAKTHRLKDLLFIAMLGAAAYGLAMPWLPLSTIAVTQYNARIVGGDFRAVYQSLPLWLCAIIGGMAALKFLTRRCTGGLQFAILFTFLTALIPLSDAWFHVTIVPQPDRYQLEMEMALAMLVAMLAYEVFKRTPQNLAVGAMVLLIVLLVPAVRICRRYARTFLITTIDITKTSEWKTADWLNHHWSGDRVMLPGSTMYWLTAFSDTPQLGGGFDQGVTLHVLPVATYAILSTAGGQWAEYSVLWLKALGVQAVGVSTSGSTEVYKPFRDSNKFEGVLEPLWKDGGDRIYRVGKPHGSLARAIPRMQLVSRTPLGGDDVDPLRGYVAALEDPAMPEARFEWTSAHTARILADLSPAQVITLQIAWHPGWHARGGSLAKDALGMMTIYPDHSGPSTIDLFYDGSTEMKVAKWISTLTLLGLALLTIRSVGATAIPRG